MKDSGYVQIKVGEVKVFDSRVDGNVFPKKINVFKHFLGWLFRYCPYGGTCPPEHPFRKSIDEIVLEAHRKNFSAGGGC